MSRLRFALTALRELGPRQLGLYALYQLGLRSGFYRIVSRASSQPSSLTVHHRFDFPDSDEILDIIGQDGLSQLVAQADEIVAGQVRLFGGQPVKLNLTPPGELSHWTDYAAGKSVFPKIPSPDYPFPDVKWIWEPARFGWAFTLGRAYHLTHDERYAHAFWAYFEIFADANPVNQGPNWESGQEVALRILAFVFAAQIFSSSPHTTPERSSRLAASIAAHAARIPLTLLYARSQNNNHLLSESAGLITASWALPDHPQARHWSKLGWKWFKSGIENQIDAQGAYLQHSTNYHRLMLQLGLWVCGISATSEKHEPWRQKLSDATSWLLALMDKDTGRVPNLGPNDGAYIFPLTVLPFDDYRPVLQAASQTFLGKPAFQPGIWDEMTMWLGDKGHQSVKKIGSVKSDRPVIIHGAHAWAYLRTAKFTGRPGHADQLHLDLWWRGLNVAQDAGTYLYNAAPPWNNALTHTAAHNTIMVNDQEQMTRAGRFLYLDRAQAEIVSGEQDARGSWQKVVARHDGYVKQGVLHQRAVTVRERDEWAIEDQLLPTGSAAQSAPLPIRLHWLLPDWEHEFNLDGSEMRIRSPYGWITLRIRAQRATLRSQLVRAGELLHGDGFFSPTWGWVSPTYAHKIPALSFSVTVNEILPVTLTSQWSFPDA